MSANQPFPCSRKASNSSFMRLEVEQDTAAVSRRNSGRLAILFKSHQLGQGWPIEPGLIRGFTVHHP
jgi:hypothetical protein